MPQSPSTPPVCRDCDGFATATITTGLRTASGTRDTLPVHCPACRGLGLSVPARLVRTGK